MEKNMENEIETRIMQWFIGIVDFPKLGVPL